MPILLHKYYFDQGKMKCFSIATRRYPKVVIIYYGWFHLACDVSLLYFIPIMITVWTTQVCLTSYPYILTISIGLYCKSRYIQWGKSVLYTVIFSLAYSCIFWCNLKNECCTFMAVSWPSGYCTFNLEDPGSITAQCFFFHNIFIIFWILLYFLQITFSINFIFI